MSATAFMLVFGAVSIPVYAGYQGFRSAITSDKVLARMQEIPKDEQQDIYNMVQYEQRSLHADQFSREYTEKEMSRRKVLQQEYENGRFPENTLETDCFRKCTNTKGRYFSWHCLRTGLPEQGIRGCISHGALKGRNGTYQYIWRKNGT